MARCTEELHADLGTGCRKMGLGLPSRCCCAGNGKGEAKAEEAISEAPAASVAEPVSPFSALSLIDNPTGYSMNSICQASGSTGSSMWMQLWP